MTTPAATGHAPPSTAMEAAAHALAEQFAAGVAWPPESPVRFRNVLLDACGSDHRPLVELLLRVGRHGIVNALQALGPTAASAWPSHRTRLVSRACGELFIGADMAAWAVDAWAVALHVVPAPAVQALQREYAERERRAAADRERAEHQHAALARLATASAQRRGGAAMGPGGVGVAGASAGPSWAGGASQGRVGAWKRGKSGPPRWRVATAAPLPSPNMPRFFALFAVVLVAMGTVVWGMRSLTPALTVVRPMSSLPPVVAPGGLPPASPNGAPTAAAESAETSTGSAAAPADNAAPSAGRTSSAPSTPAPDGTPRQSPPPSAAATGVYGGNSATGEPIRWLAMDPVAHGVGGTYRVEQRILSVSGSKLCTPVADALGRSVRRTEEEITHTPGTARFDLISRPGVRGVLQPGGAFQTLTYFGEHEGVRYSFVMRGAFTPQGFVARTVTATDAVIRYRQRQQCVIAADLVGTRLPPRGDSMGAPRGEAAPTPP